MNYTKRFEIGLADTNVKPLVSTYKSFINSFFIGIPMLNNCRSNYILIDYIKKLVDDCEDIPIWVTLNSPIVEEHNLNLIADMAIGAWKEFKFHGFTVTNYSLLCILKNHGIPVKVSTVNDIRDLNDINKYVSEGFDKIVLSYKVNRNLDFVKDAVKHFPTTQFSLITNEICDVNCPHRMGHFISTSLNQKPTYICNARQPDNSIEWRSNLLKSSFIPPINLEHYPESIIFKMPTRMVNYKVTDIITLLNLYIGNYTSKNILLFFMHHININGLKPLNINNKLSSKWLNCKNECFNCNLCDKMEKELK